MPTPDQLWQVGSVVLGAIIALATSLAVEVGRAYLGDRRARGRFKLLLGIELPIILAIVDRLVQDHADRGFIPIPLLHQIDSARQSYDKNRDWVIVLDDGVLRRDLMDFYQQLAAVTLEANSLEQLIANPGDPKAITWAMGRRPETVARFRDVATRGRALLDRLNR